MPRIRFMLLCLTVLVTACASQLPPPHISTPARADLSSLQYFNLTTMAPEQSQDTHLHSQLQGFLINAMTQRGYLLAEPANIQLQYWLSEHTTPLQINVDTPAPEPLGPYQAVHRLQDISATLRVQLRDAQQQILWEGQVDTPLSPTNERPILLKRAVETLIAELPRRRV